MALTTMLRILSVLLVVDWLCFAGFCEADIVIHEIHYDPPDKSSPTEFVELYNSGEDTVELDGWFFSHGISFTFPSGASIAPDAYVVVAQDPAALQEVFGAETFDPDGLFGPFTGKLSNRGERVVLRNPAGEVEDVVNYGVGFPWPTAAHGEGSSMELVDPTLDNNLGGSWRSSGFNLALPAERIVLIDEQAVDWRYRKATSEASDPTSAWRQLDFVEDATWQTGQTSIGYGDDDDNTVLEDMRDGYTGIYLRREFELPDDGDLPSLLMLGIYVDDGAIYWINGVEVHRWRVLDGDLPFDGTARSSEARWRQAVLPTAGGALRPGRNVLAVHALNSSISNSDFSFDARLFVPSIQDFDDPSEFGAPPSPGARNSVFAPTVPPLLRQVEHEPREPRSGDAVLVTVKATDPQGVGELTLQYQVVEPGAYIRLTDEEYDAPWETLPLRDDGLEGDLVGADSIYSAHIPADVQVHRRLVRYRIQAVDVEGNGVRVPYADDPQPNFAYFVYDGVPAWNGVKRAGEERLLFSEDVMRSVPAYHLIAQEPDVVSSQYNSGFKGRSFLGTLVHRGRVYDHIEFQNRGEFSTYVSGKNKWRFHFLRGHDFRTTDDYGRPLNENWRHINLSGLASPWVPTNRGMAGLDEGIAFRIYELAGVVSPRTTFLQFRVIDAAEEAHPTNQYVGDLWGLYMTIEQIDGRFLDERGLPDGNTYKIESGAGVKRNQGANQTATSADYNAFRTGFNSRQTIDWWRANADLPSYYSFRGINRVVNNMDLRDGWNHGVYHNGATDRWHVIPWDLDMLYMPVTHWSGVINWQNSITQNPELRLEYRNHLRSLSDLLVQPDQLEPLIDAFVAVVNPPGEPLTLVDVDEAMWNLHPRSAGGHRGAFYRNPSTHGARGGTVRRQLVTADHEGMAQWVKDFTLSGYGQTRFRAEFTDRAIPSTPEVTFTGVEGFPLDGLQFRVSQFADPDEDGSFGAMEWRLAEVLPASARTPESVLEPPGPFEIHAVWESGPLDTFTETMTLPIDVAAVGHHYRVRARMMDETGRWSHWSEPVEFQVGEPTLPPAVVSSLRVTELFYNPPGDDGFEFIEFQNIGSDSIDLNTVAITDGIEFQFASGSIENLAPGAFVVLVEDKAVFQARYGTDLPVAGEYEGRLENAGERLELTFGKNTTILEFTYSGTWYAAANGFGHSLVISDPLAPPEAWSEADGWRPSELEGGSPGRADGGAPPAAGLLPGDLTQDGRLNLLDVIVLLRHLFDEEKPPLPCDGPTILDGGNLRLADVDGGGAPQVTDALQLFQSIIGDGAPHVLGTDCVTIEGCPSRCP